MMNQESRPSAESLLARIKEEEETAKKGKLKIFFGMAAGVGKTYAMLVEARQNMDDGMDVVIGVIETHGRIETIANTEGLPVIPRRKVEMIRDTGDRITQTEMDLDAILNRKPTLVLVDELAHTNLPDSRHPKRFNDVQELLDKGINVYTTLNVQHLESVADFVEQITGIKVHERVPDAVLDLAGEIELIDISPEELRKRLTDGKIYRYESAVVAAQHFFKPENLLALREMALQTTARIVDKESLKRRTSGEILRTRERILVLVGTDSYASRLIRIGRRMAFDLKAPWFVLHVRNEPHSSEDKSRLEGEFNLARSLGAEVILIDGDLIESVEQVISERSITQVVVGRTDKRKFRFRRSLIQIIIDRIHNADLHIVPIKRDLGQGRRFINSITVQSPMKDYGIALSIISALTAICLLLVPTNQYFAPSIIFIATVALLGLILGRGPVLFAAALSALLWNFLFIPPRFTLLIDKVEDQLTFLLFFAVGIVTGSLTSKLRRSKKNLMQRQRELILLQEISESLTSASAIEDIAILVCHKLDSIFEVTDSSMMLKTGAGLKIFPKEMYIDNKEHTVAEWVIEHGRPAGRGTDTLPLASSAWLPLKTPTQGIVGALRIQIANPDLNEMNLVTTIAAQASIALERANLSKKAQLALVHEESEKLFHAILRSVSHELRSPVTAMLAAAENLSHDKVIEDPRLQNEIRQEISISSKRLARVVDQLLAMSRIESGRLLLNKEKHDLRDLISECRDHLAQDLSDHQVSIIVPSEPIVASFDFAIMRQAMIGLLHNASLHTPKGTKVTITLSQNEKNIFIIVEDNGPGIQGDMERLFEPFYRGDDVRPGGLGLGLSIAKSVIDLHGGSIHAKTSPSGSSFYIKLPIATS